MSDLEDLRFELYETKTRVNELLKENRSAKKENGKLQKQVVKLEVELKEALDMNRELFEKLDRIAEVIGLVP